MARTTPITLPEDFFTKYDWDSQDLNVLGNNAKLIQEAAAAVAEMAGTVQAQGEAIEAETQARTNGDADLQAEIDATDDNVDALTTKVNDEITNRENADTALGTRIDNEITARESADTSLGERIDTETQARTTADTEIKNSIETLISNVTTETSNRESADKTLQENIDKVASDLATETTNRTDTDSGLDARIKTLEDNVIWRGHYTFASVPAGATQTYAFQLDVSYADVEEIAPYVVTTSPFAYPYVVLVATNALTVGVRNIGTDDLADVIVYAQTVGKVANE